MDKQCRTGFFLNTSHIYFDRGVFNRILGQDPVRYMKFRNTLKGFSSRTLARRLKELEKADILTRQAYHEIPPRVEYKLTTKGQELVEFVISLLQWMRKWSNK